MMKKSVLKRFALVFMTLIICVSSVPAVFAADENDAADIFEDIYDDAAVISPAAGDDDDIFDDAFVIAPAPEDPDDVITIKTNSKYTATLSNTKFVFDRKVKTPTVTVKNQNGKKLKENKDYTVKYSSGRKHAGKYAVKVTINGKKAETIKLYFYILPSKTAKLSFSWAPTAIKAKWSKVQGANGYRVCLYKNDKLVKKAFTKELSYKFTSLEKLTEYKIAVTAFAKIDGSKILSPVSKSAVTATSTEAPKLEKGLPLDMLNVASLKWNIQSDADGYVVYMSKGKNQPFKAVSTIDGKLMRWCLVKCEKVDSLNFKIRSYRTVGDEKVLSPFSNTVTF